MDVNLTVGPPLSSRLKYEIPQQLLDGLPWSISWTHIKPDTVKAGVTQGANSVVPELVTEPPEHSNHSLSPWQREQVLYKGTRCNSWFFFLYSSPECILTTTTWATLYHKINNRILVSKTYLIIYLKRGFMHPSAVRIIEITPRWRSESALHTDLSLLNCHGLSAWGDLFIYTGQEVLRDAQGVL